MRTPRTDAELESQFTSHSDEEGYCYVSTGFARTLETELNEANERLSLERATLKGERGMHDVTLKELLSAQAEVARLREALEKLARQHPAVDHIFRGRQLEFVVKTAQEALKSANEFLK